MAETTETQPQEDSVEASDEESFELVEAVIISGPLKGKMVSVRMTMEGKFVKGNTQFTPEEMKTLQAFAEASKKVEASAVSDGENAEAVTEKPCDSTDVTPDQPPQLPPTPPTDN